ncbi:MAG: hypothetical protein Q9160_008058 [Pyrenula sp. 1 TL-2023]
MTRLYDPNGAYVCQMCLRHPKTGWLYRCTQDYNGRLPEQESPRVGPPPNEHVKQSEDPTLTTLSPWIQKAIESGQYSQEQIRVIKEQKLSVKKAVVATEEREINLRLQEQEPTRSSSTPLRPLLPRTTTLPPVLCQDSSSSSPTPMSVENVRKATLKKENQSLSAGETQIADRQPCGAQSLEKPGSLINLLGNTNVSIPMSVTAPSHLNELSRKTAREYQQMKSVYPPCNFITCPTCRPTYRERAVLPLNQVLQSEPSHLPEVPREELKNRRISDLRVVQRLGLARWLQSRRSIIDQMSGSESEINPPSNSSQSAVDSSNQPVAEDTNQGKQHKWVDRWHKTFGKIADPSKGASHSQSHSVSGRADEVDVPIRSMLLKRRRKISSPVPADAETSNLREAMYYNLGVNTPLPGGADDTEHIEGSEVEVEDGVAVTEEGVTLSAADIIMPA